MSVKNTPVLYTWKPAAVTSASAPRQETTPYPAMRAAHCLAETQGNHSHSRKHPAQLKKCQLTGGGAGDDAVGPGG
jgi:hypothetical protein